MITGEFAVIRTAEEDDAAALRQLYDPAHPRPPLLDRKRELLMPTVDELREVLSQKEAKKKGLFYVIENSEGIVRGFCSIRGAHPEVRYAELVLLFFSKNDYRSPVVDEVLEFLFERAYVRMQLNKLVVQCLGQERDYLDFLLHNGFTHEGVQRDVMYVNGRWENLESLSLLRAEYERMQEPHH